MIGDERYTDWRGRGQIKLPTGTTPQQAASILMEAIENKRIGATSNVILLLDAVRLPWLALQTVVSEFRRLYDASDLKGLFKAIYVVPWHESAVRRLDA